MALDSLTKKVALDPLNYFRTTTVNPPGLDANYRRTRPIGLGEAHLRLFSDRKAIASNQKQYTSGQIEPQVAWIKFKEDMAFTHGVSFDVEYAASKDNPRDYTDVSGEFEEKVTAGDRLPVWYLPWDPDYLVRLTIPAYRTENECDFGGGVKVDPYNPHLFFTAGLTGCSVFAYGDPRSPTVVHAGTMGKTPYGDDCARFWRELLLVERFQRLQHEGLAHEVNVDHYMGQTSSLKDFRTWLGRQPSQFIVEQTIPFGSVFGVRYGRLWSFYLQENAFIKRFTLQKVKKIRKYKTGGVLGLFQTEVTDEVEIEVKSPPDYTTRPICVRPFFPHGAQATFWQTFRKSYV
jgi:hypothetical protein